MSEHATPAPQEDSLLGEIVLRNRLLSRHELEDALALQRQVHDVGAKMKLGEILLQKGLIDTRTLDALLRVQSRLHAGESHPLALRRAGLTPKEDMAIGEMAVRNGLIPEERLQFALRMQAQLRGMGFERRIGEILAREGVLTEADVEALLQIQKHQVGRADEPTERLRRAAEQKDLAHVDLLFGQIAVEHGFTTQPIIDQALEVQRLAREMDVNLSLGEILFEQKHLSDDGIAQIAHIQNVKRETFFEISMSKVMARKVDDHSVGDILCERGVLDPWQIKECLKVQAALGRLGINRPLGEVLLDKGYVSHDLLYSALDEQLVRRAEEDARRRRVEVVRRAALFCVRILLPILLGGGILWSIYDYSYEATARRLRQAQEAEEAARAALLSGAQRGPAILPIPAGAFRSLLDLPASRPIAGEERETEEAVLAGERLDAETWSRVEARAKRLFSDFDPAVFETTLVGTETEQGLVFEIFGQAPLPDGLPVTTQILYYGAPVTLGAKSVRMRGGRFYARTGPLPGRRWPPPGLYTATAEFAAERAGVPAAELRAAGLPLRMGAEHSAYLGSTAAEHDFADMLRTFHQGLLSQLTAWERELRAHQDEPPPAEGALPATARLERWERELVECERSWAAYELGLLATRYPEADQRMRAILPQARRALQATATVIHRAAGDEPPPALLYPVSGPEEAVIPLEHLQHLRGLLQTASAWLPARDAFDPVGEWAARDVRRRVAVARQLRAEFAGGRAPWREDLATAPGEGTGPVAWLLRWTADVQDLRRVDRGIHELLSSHPAAERYTRVDAMLACLLELGKAAAAPDAGGSLAPELRPTGTQPIAEVEARFAAILAELGD